MVTRYAASRPSLRRRGAQANCGETRLAGAHRCLETRFADARRCVETRFRGALSVSNSKFEFEHGNGVRDPLQIPPINVPVPVPVPALFCCLHQSRNNPIREQPVLLGDERRAAGELEPALRQ
jgi:hypothetical protein